MSEPVTGDRVSKWLGDSGNLVIEFAEWLLVRDTIADMIKSPFIDRAKTNEIAENLMTAGYISVDTIVNNWRAARADDALLPSPLDDENDLTENGYLRCPHVNGKDDAYRCTKGVGHEGNHSYMLARSGE